MSHKDFVFTNPKMTRESLPSTSTSKSNFLPEISTISPCLYITSDSLDAEIMRSYELRAAMKYVTSHYSQRSMDEMSDLMTFTGSKISGSITLGYTKLVYVI